MNSIIAILVLIIAFALLIDELESKAKDNKIIKVFSLAYILIVMFYFLETGAFK